MNPYSDDYHAAYLLEMGSMPPIHSQDQAFAYLNVSFNSSDITIKQLCMNLHFFHGLVSAMNIILGHYNLIIHLELIV